MFNIGLDRENIKKIFLTETTRQIALIFGMKHHLVDSYQINSKNAPGSKNDLVTDKDKDKEALFNVAYNVTDNISS